MLRGIWIRVVLTVWTAVVALPVACALVLVPGWESLPTRAGRLWSRLMLAVVGARVRFHSVERARLHEPCIFIANHQSMVDIWAMLLFLPERTRFVAKKELFHIPILGWAMRAAGYIAIDRGNRAAAIHSLELAAERIRKGRSVVLYPEGTRSRDGRLQPFKKGAFHLALRAGVPVVPVAITGTFEVMPTGRLTVRPGPVDVFVESPIDVGPYLPDDHQGLLARVHETISRRFDPRQAQASSSVRSIASRRCL